MPQKLVSQAYSVSRALDKTGDISHYKGFFLVDLYHSKHRGKGGKVVVGYFGFCGGYHGNKSGFAHIWKSYQTHVRNKLKFK